MARSWLKLNIRLRLLIPIFVMTLAFFVVSYYFWYPNYVKSYQEQYLKFEKDNLKVVASLLGSSGKLAKDPEILREINSSHSKWIKTVIRDNNGKKVFSVLRDNSRNLTIIDSPIYYRKQYLGFITVGIKLENAIQQEKLFPILVLFISFIIIAFLLIALVQDIWIRKPLNQLAYAATLMKNGDFDVTLPIPAKDEIGKLVDAFESMRSAVLQRQTKLIHNQNWLNTILENILEGLLTSDSSGTILSVNPKIEEMFGFGTNELLGQNISILMPKQHSLQHDMHLQNYIKTGESKVLGNIREFYGVRKDGDQFPIELLVSEFRDKDARYFIAVIRDITDKKIEQQKLLSYTHRLEQVNRELDDFAYIASHDLKEPLRGIHNYAGFLLEDYEKTIDDDGKQKLQTLMRLSERLETLIDDLLSYSRIGRLDLSVEAQDLNQIVQDVVESIKISLEEKHIDLKICENLPAISCDKTLMQEVYRNLITNAMKYNDKDHKTIEIGLAANDGDKHNDYTFYVKDNGIGIADKHKDSIFRIFKRLHGRDKFGGGTGAGLTIVKKIIEKHHGRVWLESEKNIGTTFKFSLPKSRTGT